MAGDQFYVDLDISGEALPAGTRLQFGTRGDRGDRPTPPRLPEVQRPFRCRRPPLRELRGRCGVERARHQRPCGHRRHGARGRHRHGASGLNPITPRPCRPPGLRSHTRSGCTPTPSQLVPVATSTTRGDGQQRPDVGGQRDGRHVVGAAWRGLADHGGPLAAPAGGRRVPRPTRTCAAGEHRHGCIGGQVPPGQLVAEPGRHPVGAVHVGQVHRRAAEHEAGQEGDRGRIAAPVGPQVEHRARWPARPTPPRRPGRARPRRRHRGRRW